MFGTYRLYLALCVASTHYGGGGFIGCYAVFAFFVLSGYMMSLTLDQRYLQLPYGRARFLLNRAIRIYPLHWVILLLSAIYITYVPDAEKIFKPYAALDWLKNITTIGMVNLKGEYKIPNLNGTVWSLAAEMIFWCVLAMLWPSRTRIYAFMVAAVGYTAYLMAVHGVFAFPARYNNPLAAALPFAVGAGVYLLKEKGITIPPRLGIVLVLATVLAMASGDKVFKSSSLDGFYSIMLLNGLVVLYLARIKPKKGWLEQLDRWCGDLSYPLFVSHLLIGSMLKAHLFQEMNLTSWAFFIRFLPVVLLVSALLHYAVTVPLERVRVQLRKPPPKKTKKIMQKRKAR